MARAYQFNIGTREAGLRLDQYLAIRLPIIISRTMVQRTIRHGLVTVSGQPAKAHYRLHQGDRIVATMDQLPAKSGDAVLLPQAIPLDIRYEDDTVLVINKPAGLVTHPAPGHWDGTLVNAVLWHLAQEQGSSPPLLRAGIVHRLDKDTSGLLLVAKTSAAHLVLARQLKARTIKRRYLAIVEGHLPLDAGTIDAPIGRHAQHRKLMTIRSLGGRSAVTHYRVLQRQWIQASEVSLAWSLVELSLETGRTHQIRVHLTHLGYPVIGDLTYGRRSASFWQRLGVGRQLLHAMSLQFHHPVTRQLVDVSAPIPADLARWIESP